MQARSIILSVAVAAVFVAFLMVIMDSQGARSADVDEEELDKAMSSYKRSASASSSGASESGESRNTTPRIPKTRARPTAPPADDTGDSKTETYSAPPPSVETEVFEEKADLKNQMNEANRRYDKADYEGARESALEVLENNPHNVRMQRIVVSSSCIMGDEGLATEHFSALPARDQRQMARRCKRYGIEFAEEQ